MKMFRCECSRIHLTVGIGPLSECACGAPLWDALWAAAGSLSGLLVDFPADEC